MLQSLGYSEKQIKVANNGQECLELLTEQMSDCVLMDVQVSTRFTNSFILLDACSGWYSSHNRNSEEVENEKAVHYFHDCRCFQGRCRSLPKCWNESLP